MKLTVLTDNVAGGTFLAEHGLSFLIEENGSSLLFDTGHSDVFLKNAQQLKIDLQNKIDLIVLSHGHWDHGNGLRFLKSKPLITHPSSFIKRFRKRDKTSIGLSLSEENIENRFQLKTSRKPLKITNTIFFLGQIPRLNDFEAQTTAFENENGEDDFVADDSALAIIQEGRLIIISGCAHSGICNICEYAKQVAGVQFIHAVIGGFHLKYNTEQTKETIRYFQEQKVEQLFPSHCMELPALAAFHKAFNVGQLKTGQTLVF